MKIIAVGMNYVAHCHELHADENLPEEPVIFMKPDSALPVSYTHLTLPTILLV